MKITAIFCVKMNDLNSLVQDVQAGVANLPLKTKYCETSGHSKGGGSPGLLYYIRSPFFKPSLYGRMFIASK